MSRVHLESQIDREIAFLAHTLRFLFFSQLKNTTKKKTTMTTTTTTKKKQQQKNNCIKISQKMIRGPHSAKLNC